MGAIENDHMKVFISWSGSSSRDVARAVTRWLPLMLPEVDPWFSDQDIQPGDRWSVSLQDALTKSDFGVLCVTPANVESAWLLFEAGAISRAGQAGAIVPLLFGLSPADLPAPLREFQATAATREGLWRLCQKLNDNLQRRIDGQALEKSFRKHWPWLASRVSLGPQGQGTSLIRSEASLKDRLASLAEFHSGLINLATSLEKERFTADVAIGCGRSGAVLAGILATNLGIPYVLALDRVAKETPSQTLRYSFGGLARLTKNPKERPTVLLCSMIAETGETIDITRRLLRSRGWPSDPGKELQVVALYASGSVRYRHPYVIIGCTEYRGWSHLDELPYMFRRYDLRFSRPPRQSQGEKTSETV